MASVSRTSSSSINSIYGTRNVISGLASGMDTESMIENAVSGYKLKISSLTQQRTKLSWQQESYRNIITSMAGFSSKYASYTSSTNLMSSSFFNQAVRTVTNGANASKVAASGRGSSNVAINGVKQLATAATYKLSGSALMGGNSAPGGYASAEASGSFSLDKMNISTFNGTMSLAYGSNQTLSFSFTDGDVFNSAEEMASFMNKQLENQTISLSSGGSKKASEMLTVQAGDDGTISFVDKAGNNVYIKSVSPTMAANFETLSTGEGSTSFKVGKFQQEVGSIDYLSSSTMSITLDGVTKSFSMPDKAAVNKYLEEAGIDISGKAEADLTTDEISARNDAYIKALQDKIDNAFGTLADGSSKLKVINKNAAAWAEGGADGNPADIRLGFEAGQEGSTFVVGSEKGKSMGFGDSELTSYLNTNRTLKDLLGEEGLKGLETGKDENGNTTYAFKINNVTIGEFTEDTELSTIISRVNSNKDAGVNISYSRLTNEFTFTAKESGKAGKIEFSQDGLAGKLFGGAKLESAGQDAIFTATVDGKQMELTRSSNTVDFDGLSVTLKERFGYEVLGDDGNPKKDAEGNIIYGDKLNKGTEAVSFTTSADADKIVDTIRAFVDDYNAMVTQIKSAYSTMPLQRASGAYYEPLTDDEKSGMSESEIKNWEDNAKAGLLFGDRDLSSLYSRLTDAVSMYGQDGADLKAAGITVSYSNGLSTLSFDENTLRDTLNSDPDRVRDIFAKSQENGAATNGLMAALKDPLDAFGATTGAVKGTLVEKAGSPLSPTSIYSNYLQTQMDLLDTQIQKWQDKMSDKVDYYTTQFSKLEQLIAQMNSQSSSLSQMAGSY